jgi:hypothetical protein
LATSRSHNYGKNESEFALSIKENVWNVHETVPNVDRARKAGPQREPKCQLNSYGVCLQSMYYSAKKLNQNFEVLDILII